MADFIAEISAQRGADTGKKNEQEQVHVLRRHDDDHDIRDARQRQRDKGRVDDRDEQEADEAEVKQIVEEGVGMRTGAAGGLQKAGKVNSG